jgi:hypothetical protein
VVASLDHEITQHCALHKGCVENVWQLRQDLAEEEEDEWRLQLHDEIAVASEARVEALRALREV